jgi:catechol 2,3-dioxygenase-like lactoylglutathione lyase family enzyme
MLAAMPAPLPRRAAAARRGSKEATMRLNHVTLIVTDFERSAAFYRALGLLSVVDSPPRYARFRCPDSDETLSIEVTGEAALPARAQLYFECPDLGRTVAELRSKGFAFAQEPTDMPYRWREARLRDPDGHDIRLYYAADNRLNPPWRVKEAG